MPFKFASIFMYIYPLQSDFTVVNYVGMLINGIQSALVKALSFMTVKTLTVLQ
jgi:hypothetical protein